jgi:hypothetical protein
MGYVIAAILVLLIVAAGVAFFMLRATRREGQASIVAPDEGTPLGDTDQHAGRQTAEGRTTADPEGGGERKAPESERLADRPR